ncbi:MAG: tetratricopeptide repeat protein [Thermaurantimonas sp.]|uniref:tetratricopeptide repeat protein n=1 Tax=Thermaurantimonas sp. TaxID=2681568 RepID=UPI00391BC3E1
MKDFIKIVIFYLINISIVLGQISPYKRKINEGNEYFDKKRYEEASNMYREAISKRKDKPADEAQYNYGNSIYKLNNFDKAISIFENLAQSTEDKKIRSRAFHNLGNSYYQRKDYRNALEAYRNALILNPEDAETQYNYARTYSMIMTGQNQNNNNNNSQNTNESKEENRKQNTSTNEGNNSDNKIEMDEKILENILKYIESKDQSIQEKVRNKEKKKNKTGKNEKDW